MGTHRLRSLERCLLNQVGVRPGDPPAPSPVRSTQTDGQQLPQPALALPASELSQSPGDNTQCTDPAGETASSSQAALIPGARTKNSLTREIQKAEPPQKSIVQVQKVFFGS